MQSVHDDQNSRNYRKLEHLISYVLQPYLSSTGLRAKPSKPVLEVKTSESSEEPTTCSTLDNTTPTSVTPETVTHSNRITRPVSVGSLELQSKYSADRLHEAALQTAPHARRRFTFNESLAESSGSSVFGSSSSTVT